MPFTPSAVFLGYSNIVQENNADGIHYWKTEEPEEVG